MVTRTRARFLSLGTIDVLDHVILCCGAVLCITGSLLASLASLDASRNPPLPQW